MIMMPVDDVEICNIYEVSLCSRSYTVSVNFKCSAVIQLCNSSKRLGGASQYDINAGTLAAAEKRHIVLCTVTLVQLT